MKVKIALIPLLLAILACGIPVNAPLPTVTATAIKLPTVTPKPLPTVEKSWTAQVTLPTVNVRDEPDGDPINAVTVGSTVTVLKCVGNWCKIKKPAGWIWRGCLSDNPDHLGCTAK